MSSSSFIKHKYVVLLLKIDHSKMATPTNDASKLVFSHGTLIRNFHRFLVVCH